MKKVYSVNTVFLLLLFAWVAILVAFWPIIDIYKETDHLWISCHTIQIVTHWIDGNPFSTHFAMLHLPASIETPTLESQRIYPSYPPGFALPVWGLSLLFSTRPDIFIVRLWNLFLQLNLSLGIAYFAWNSSKNFGKRNAFVASMLAGLFYLLSNTSLLFHYSAYFSDQFVLLPIIFILCYEITEKKTLFFRIIAPFFVFLGGLSDPFIYFVGGLVFVYRFICGIKEHKLLQRILSSTYITVPLFIAFCLYIYQVVSLDQVNVVLDKLSYRTSDHSNSLKFSFMTVLLHYKIDKSIILVPVFVVLTLIKVFFHKNIFKLIKNNDILSIFAISIIFHTLLFLNHSAVHNFSIMKYQVFFSIIMGICLACLLYENKTKYIPGIAILTTGIIAFLAASSIIKIYNTHELHNIELAKIIKMNHSYEDIFISAEFEISYLPPQLSSISDKPIYLYKGNAQNSLLTDFGHYLGKANFHYVISDKYFTEGQLTVICRKYPKITVDKFNNVNMPNILILNLGKQTNPAEFLKFVKTVVLKSD